MYIEKVKNNGVEYLRLVESLNFSEIVWLKPRIECTNSFNNIMFFDI